MAASGSPKKDRNRIRRLAVALILVASGVVAAGFLLNGLDDRGSEVPGLVIDKPGRGTTDAEVEAVDDADTTFLDRFSEPAGGIYSVTGASPTPAEPLGLRFSIPPGLSLSESRQLVVASAEKGDHAWVVQSGRLEGDRFVVRATHLTWFQLRLPRFSLSGVNEAERLLGAKARAPRCQVTPPDVHLAVEDSSRILLGPCLAVREGRTVLAISNNRAIGLAYSLPRGARVTRSASPSLSEDFYEVINGGVPFGDERIVPGAGTIKIEFKELPVEIEFKATPSAFVYDALLLAVGSARGSKEAAAAHLARYAKCAHKFASSVREPPESALEAFDLLRDGFGACGQLLGGPFGAAGAVALGVPKFVFSLWDSFRSVIDASAVITVERKLRPTLPTVDADAVVGTVLISDAGKELVAPDRVDFGGNHPTYLDELSWSNWGSETEDAVGMGIYHYNSCRPNCGAANYVEVDGTLLLPSPPGDCGDQRQYRSAWVSPANEPDGSLYSAEACGAPLMFIGSGPPP